MNTATDTEFTSHEVTDCDVLFLRGEFYVSMNTATDTGFTSHKVADYDVLFLSRDPLCLNEHGNRHRVHQSRGSRLRRLSLSRDEEELSKETDSRGRTVAEG